MALSQDFVDAHIARWQQSLTSPFYPHRKHWPTRLFHHAPLENAVAILREGVLRSRNDTYNTHPKDVAAPGVISANTAAHDFVRLYFRPKTPTQYHIEGIRRPNECKYEGAHAPVLIMFALDSRAVLARPDVQFSDMNMQKLGSVKTGNTAEFFDTIQFIKVFSEVQCDKSYTDARCAEVLTKSPLRLDTCLKEIYFRSEPERDTILHMLGPAAERWANQCIVSDTLKVFQKDYAFVQEVGLTPKGVTFGCNARRDRANLAIEIEVFDATGSRCVHFVNDEIEARPPDAARWIYNKRIAPGIYLVRMRIDGHLAHESLIPLGDVVF